MTDSVSDMMFAAAVTQAEQAARVQRRNENPYRCTSCSYASHAASTDADGLCPWCRAEVAKAEHMRRSMDLVAPVPHVADDRDAVYLDERGEWVR